MKIKNLRSAIKIRIPPRLNSFEYYVMHRTYIGRFNINIIAMLRIIDDFKRQ